MPNETPIVEDLRLTFSRATEAKRHGYATISLTTNEVFELIKRVSRAEAENERLKAPVECARCKANGVPSSIPRDEAIKCADCKAILCSKHLYLHFTEEDRRIRDQLADRTKERDYRLTEVAHQAAQIAELQRTVERLEKPVSDEEWADAKVFYDGTDHDYDESAMMRDQVDALLAARKGE